MNNLKTEVSVKNSELFKVIFNGVEVEDVVKSFDREGRLKVLFAGRIEKSKGVIDLIESVKDLDVDLNIAGSGNLKDFANELVNSYGISGKVSFLGKLTSKELKDYYLNSDILVVPSLRVEGFPMSIIEGMSYYLPVIATKSGGNVDAVVDNKTGFLVEVGDVSGLKEKIKYFDTYPEKIKEFGLNARNNVEHKFSLGIMKSEYKKIVESLMK
jgi:glycosyltransferase involved in cell wall biosynthesis